MSIDKEALASFSELGRTVGEHTLIKHIKLLDAGFIFRVSEGGVKPNLGFVANFGLPFMLTIKGVKTHTDTRRFLREDLAITCFTQLHTYLHISPLPLHDFYAYNHTRALVSATRCITHGFIAPKVTSPEAIIEIIKNYLDMNIIVPQPLRDRIIPSPIGYHSLYRKPFQFLLENGKALIYNNGMYTLFTV